MLKISLLTVTIVAAIACGGGKGGQAVNNTKPTGGTLLTIGELEFVEGANDVGIKLHADGKVETKGTHSDASGSTTSWKTMGELTADGKVMRDGKVLGTLNADGTFASADGKTAPWKIDGDTLVSGSRRVSIDANGLLVGGNPDMKKELHIKGITDAGSRRAALLIMGLMFGSAPEQGTSSTSTADPCGP